MGLTAAHCLCDAEASDLTTFGNTGDENEHRVIRYYLNEGYDCEKRSWHTYQRDIAVVEFDGVFAHTSLISTRPIKKGTL